MTEEEKTKKKDLSPDSSAEDLAKEEGSELRKLLSDKTYLTVPNAGDIAKGIIVSVSKREIRIDMKGFRTGIVRGGELSIDPGLSELKVGDEIEAVVLELENENGEMELSLRSAGQKRAWDKIKDIREKKEAITISIVEANKGGLIGLFEGAQGFLPVSQLSPENYPRVNGGDKTKILEKLRGFIGQKLKVKILDADKEEEKLIFSEKNLWEEEQKTVIEKYKVGDVVEGEISALTDFGAFVKFNDLEGLIHISEIAWQRIDHPSDILKVDQSIKAEIVGIEGSKIFLSIKKLEDDPWAQISKKFKIGQIVKGKILKINPFGFFVELDEDIHGLAHISELGLPFGKKPEDIAKPDDEREFKIISIEPNYHRLGLSLKSLKKEDKESKEDKSEPAQTETNKKEEKPANAEAPSSTPSSEAPAKGEENPKESVEKKEKDEKAVEEEATKETVEETPKEPPTEETQKEPKKNKKE